MFEIETARCRIRPWLETPAEHEAFRRWTDNVQMMRFISGAAWDNNTRREFFARQKRVLEQSGFCFGVAELSETGEIVGVAGGAPLELLDDWQIGWWVDPAWQGKGLGTEFATAILRYTLDEARRPRALAVIAPANIASKRVAEKAGMQYADTVRANTLESRWKDEDVVLYEANLIEP